MSAEKVIIHLLESYSGVTDIADTSICMGDVPQGWQMPAVSCKHISSTERTTAAMNEASTIVSSRIQVSALAKDYPTMKRLLSAIRKACKNKSGVIDGITVFSVVIASLGPDVSDSTVGIFERSVDFRVTYAEPNT